MITKFYNRSLEALSSLFGLTGTIARTNHLDLGPINQVVEVGRIAMAAQGFDCIATLSGVTAGAGAAVFSASSPLAAAVAGSLRFNNKLQARNLTSDDIDFWLVGIRASMTTGSSGNLSRIDGGIEIPEENTDPRLLMTWDTQGVPLDTAAGRIPLLQSNASLAPNLYLPFRVDQASRLMGRFVDDAGGVLDARITFHLWVTPRGTFPPRA